MKTIIYTIIISTLLCACSNNKFTIEGKINDGKNKIIYLEKVSLNGIRPIDSTEIGWFNKFSFSIPSTANPELYRLRIDNEYIIVAVDTTETINIKGNADNFATNFSIENSPNTELIRQLRASNINIITNSSKWSKEKINEEINNHQKLAKDIVLLNTRSLAAYYAIHQTIEGQYYLSPYNKEHLPYWSAVATAFDVFHPTSERSKELKRITLNAIKHKRMNETPQDIVLDANPQINGYIEIAYPDRSGKTQKLSSLIGKVVVIDFTAYAIETAPIHTLFLRDLHQKYADSGFEIYQVSIDENKLFWMEQSQTTPWICVRDNNSPNSVILATYNVTEIPTMFIMNREGDIVGRFSHKDLEKAILEHI